MSISPKKRIIKKIGNSHLVWFEESNSWVQFEEPAWFVYRYYNSGTTIENISQKFSRRYEIKIKESLTFVKDIIKEIQKLSAFSFQAPEIFSAQQFESPLKFFSHHSYQINNKIIEVSYGSRLLEYIIHPSFAHLEVKNISNPYFRLETFSNLTSTILKIANKAWIENNPSLLKRRLFIEITNLIYGKSDKDWLSFIHGSAVSNGEQTIILSTACGSGKSTLAALLCKRGLRFVSDDYVSVDSRFCKAYPFPAALSVKDGSYSLLLPLYSQLKDAEVFHFKGTDKTVRYLSFPAEKNFYKPLPVRNLVFIQYNPEKTFSFRKVPVLEAIRRFNEEAWVSHLPGNARKFIKWFPGLKCYELEYSENERAVKEILGLFEAN